MRHFNRQSWPFAALVCAAAAGALVLLTASLSFADAPDGGRAYIGVRVAPGGVPEALGAHLGLSPGQGVLVADLVPDGPAARAGIERHDVLVGLAGKALASFDQLSQAVKTAGVGATIPVEVIHRGKRKTVDVTVAEAPVDLFGQAGDFDPSRGFQAQRQRLPGWGGLPDPFQLLDKLESDALSHTPGFSRSTSGTRQIYTERVTQDHGDAPVSWEVTIDGDPHSDDAKVTIHHGTNTYEATIGDLDALPSKEMAVAKAVVERAKSALHVDPNIEAIDDVLGSVFGKPEQQRSLIEEFFDRDGRSVEELFGPKAEKLRL